MGCKVEGGGGGMEFRKPNYQLSHIQVLGLCTLKCNADFQKYAKTL